MSKNQLLGMLSSIVLIAGVGVAGLDVTGVAMVPARAASKLNGRADLVEDARRENSGGSMRVNGAETRLLCMSRRCFGDRPAGAVRGARGDEVLALLREEGVCRRDRLIEGGAIDVAGEMSLAAVNLNVGFDISLKLALGDEAAFTGALSLFLLRLFGDAKVNGSTFSESLSSSCEEGVNRRFVGGLRAIDLAGAERDDLSLLSTSGLESTPTPHPMSVIVLNPSSSSVFANITSHDIK